MATAVKGIFIIGAKRTPFATYGGAFKTKSITDLQTVACKAALDSSGISPNKVDTVIIGNVFSLCARDGSFLARNVSIGCGVPIEKPSFAINKLCGSGFQAVINGAQDILTGTSRIALTGGTESSSGAPFVMRNHRFGHTLGATMEFEDPMLSGLTEAYGKIPLALTAENLAEKYGITREDADKFALRSQQSWKAGQDAGAFAAEIAPVTLVVKRKEVDITFDEHPKPQTTLDGLAKLGPIVKKNGVVTAGSSSGLSDGAGAVILASEEAVKTEGLKPLARLAGWSVVGVDPAIMGIGPVPAIENLLKATKLTLNDIDLIEINEAFAPQTLACAKSLNLDMDKLNVNGGAIAMGHPFAASGARITAHLVHELRRRGLKRGIGSACIGGGQGIALLIEV